MGEISKGLMKDNWGTKTMNYKKDDVHLLHYVENDFYIIISIDQKTLTQWDCTFDLKLIQYSALLRYTQIDMPKDNHS